MGGSVIYGCMFEAPETFSTNEPSTYLLVNGKKRVYFPVFTDKKDYLGIKGAPVLYYGLQNITFPEYFIDSYDIIGSVQCVVYNNKTMIQEVISDEKVAVKLKGLSLVSGQWF